MPKEIPMCVQCRKDKQCCRPKNREWPRRCDRCQRHNYKCSPNTLKRDETEGAESGRHHDRRRPAKEIIMHLDYLQYLRAGLKNAVPLDLDPVQLEYFTVFLYIPAVDAIEAIFEELKKEAEDIRDSLILSDKIFEAHAIDEMLGYRSKHEEPYSTASLKVLLTSETRANNFSGVLGHPLWDLYSGRIFSLITRFQNRSDSENFDRCEFIGAGADSRRSINLFLEAKKVESKILEKYITLNFVTLWRQRSTGLGNVKDILRAIDPIDLRAVRCLGDHHTVEYISGTDAIACGLRSLSGRDIFRVAIHEKEGQNPLIWEFFSSRFPYRQLLGKPCPPLHSLYDPAQIPPSPEIYRATIPMDNSFLHVVTSAGSLWAPREQPLILDLQPMELYPRVELNALALAVVYGRDEEVARILSSDVRQILYRTKISDMPFIAFPGPAHRRVHLLNQEFSVFHLAAWNARATCLAKLLEAQRNSVILRAEDVTDLYAIAVMHRNKNLIKVLEKYSWRKFVPVVEVDTIHYSESRFSDVTSLILDRAPYLIVEGMVSGQWFKKRKSEKDIFAALENWMEYWTSYFPISQNSDIAFLWELKEELRLVTLSFDRARPWHQNGGVSPTPSQEANWQQCLKDLAGLLDGRRGFEQESREPNMRLEDEPLGNELFEQACRDVCQLYTVPGIDL
ncbi:hypothetical protein H072_11442 [Dactylellina haptotyla CBS 200.50]|uniref:Zn(2)-C6 fungal-type domain-containing protein n=1 Tax=Dactylellina haptotyla (strain CBS 200.50) TaxID=1284197 RepID=S8B857_DACHA|nr:hypothetical protein H072_11442 [Dactylellina haptotyla CBS 200.50]